MEAPLSEEDKVISVLVSLLDSYGVLVTALEASENVPSMEVVTERLLLNEERQHKEREERTPNPCDEKAPQEVFTNGVSVSTVGGMDISRAIVQRLAARKDKAQANKVAKEADDTSGSESLVVEHEALSIGLASNWIVTYHV